jgi:hypothetical protein
MEVVQNMHDAAVGNFAQPTQIEVLRNERERMKERKRVWLHQEGITEWRKEGRKGRERREVTQWITSKLGSLEEMHAIARSQMLCEHPARQRVRN